MQQTIHNIYGFSEEYQVFFQQRFDDLFDILEIEDKLFISLFQFNYHITKYTNKKSGGYLLTITDCDMFLSEHYNYKKTYNPKYRFPTKSITISTEDPMSHKEKISKFINEFINEILNDLFPNRNSEIVLDNELVCNFSLEDKTILIEVLEMKKNSINKHKNNPFFNHLLFSNLLSVRKPLIHDGSGSYEKAIDTARASTENYIAISLLNITGEFNLKMFQNANEISSLKYEGDECVGKILFCKNIEPIKEKIIFIDKMPLDKHKGVRKLLEIATDDIYLLASGKEIYGFFETDEDSFKSLSGYSITFTSHAKWDFEEFGEPKKKILSVGFGTPKLPKKSLEESEFVNGFKTVFKNKYDYKKIWALTLEACKQRKGTMLIITEEAESEANRLCNQCFKIDYSPESQNFKELIKYITSIDGGVLLHPNGKCYAIGTILDGKSVNTLGDITRGARYNSALRYINDSSSENCLIIIVSEDGMISLKHSKNLHEN
ncbi:TPA: diadenylate cyclase [Bacillus paranthracis]|uniref:diadenylate cyclase n=1 Tax=Bacillus cereus group TaxID=86661 RepID=UPI0018AD56AF|nr:diadenylate cyclase [Bacillus paranthracis]QPI80809.1 DNA integrity scanning protein DisA nucleotide-binding domain protein [Bacillus paranthracis]